VLYLCELYKEFRMEDMFEWDENKNTLNKRKHNVGLPGIIPYWIEIYPGRP